MLVLCQHVEPLYARDLLASGEGAVGYLLKDRVADVDEFVAAVRRVAGGGTVLDPEVVAGLVAGSAGTPAGPAHRPRARGATLMAEGRSNAAIAGRLFVSEKAVGKHTNAIFTKLDLPQAHDDNRRVLAVLAWLQGHYAREMTTAPGPRSRGRRSCPVRQLSCRCCRRRSPAGAAGWCRSRPGSPSSRTPPATTPRSGIRLAMPCSTKSKSRISMKMPSTRPASGTARRGRRAEDAEVELRTGPAPAPSG